jgi:hypothetical protein
MILLCIAAYYAVIFLSNAPLDSYGGVRGLAFFLMFAWLLKGGFFQKLFAFFLPYLLTMWLFTVVEAILKLLMEHGTGAYYVTLTAVTLTVFAGYMAALIKFGRPLFKRLFEPGRPAEWALYSLRTLFSFFLLMLFRFADINPSLYILFLVFILWSFIDLCLAIINTHEKSKQKHEADFARYITSSRHEHYQKMNEMYDTLSILHNDYKYHLSTISELMNKMEIDEIKKYLSDAQAQLPDTDVQHYCSNSVINALLASYAKRCIKENIEFDVQLAMPEPLPITNYDICIILGNLLENAVEASQPEGNLSPDGLRRSVPVGAGGKLEKGKIALVVKIQGSYLAVMASNNFSGVITAENGQPVSAKKNGGFGLRSIRAVTARYEGHTLFEWDAGIFTAYVMLKMGNEK